LWREEGKDGFCLSLVRGGERGNPPICQSDLCDVVCSSVCALVAVLPLTRRCFVWCYALDQNKQVPYIVNIKQHTLRNTYICDFLN
jgi:hypothetical protein